MSYSKLSLITFFSLSVIACGGGGGGSSSGSSASSTGQLSIDVTDGPVENASEVVVAFSSIEVKPEDGDKQTITFDSTQTINLLDYQGENFISLLNDHDLESGDYSWMRLIVDDSETYIVVSGTQHPLTIPSGSQSGLKLNDGFTITDGEETHIVIDFELRQSVHQTGGGDYKMKPVIRQVDPINADTLSGIVADALVLDADCNNDPNDSVGNAVYLFSGFDSAIQDIRGNANDPLTTAAVNYDSDDSRYEFTLGFVPHGNYTLTFTCDAVLDDATETNNDVDFSTPLNVTVDNSTGSVTLN